MEIYFNLHRISFKYNLICVLKAIFHRTMPQHPVVMRYSTNQTKFRVMPHRIYRNLLTKQIKSEDLINFAILRTNSVAKKQFKSRQVTVACSSRSTMTTKMLKTRVSKIRRSQSGLNLIGSNPRSPQTGAGSLSIRPFSRN